MDTMTPMGISHGDQKEWQTQEYHGKQMHVCTTRRSHENEELSGHGEQWDFKVRITDSAGQEANELASAESDPGSLYSTQPVAEDLGFTKGRELVEGM